MTAPEKLRAELERLRRPGYAFRQARPVAVSVTVRDEGARPWVRLAISTAGATPDIVQIKHLVPDD